MKSINILMIDDDAINLKLTEVMLKKHANVNEIIKASNGLDALGVLDKRGDIDLILLDIVMPVMNGLEFLSNVYSKNSNFNIPIVVLTTDETVKKEAMSRGANGFIAKPIAEQALIQEISKLIDLG
ncbi:two-component system response regulator [Campylobacter blaseri]|uniref:response regulator n=1 Tax=Campylobacter blaseri TaxID=2042961 RepID=UPI001F4F0732|nr:response regulator [Campylobacter blaseri]QKF85692.1 two-component system response regulator [Campylobacter blaseri]